MFLPSGGSWSREEFDTPLGGTFSDPAKIGVSGGYLRILPQHSHFVFSQGTNFAPVSHWDFTCTGDVSGYFDFKTGAGGWHGQEFTGSWTIAQHNGAGTYLLLDCHSPFKITGEEGDAQKFTFEFDYYPNDLPNYCWGNLRGSVAYNEPNTTGAQNLGILVASPSFKEFFQFSPLGIQALSGQTKTPLPRPGPWTVRMAYNIDTLELLTNASDYVQRHTWSWSNTSGHPYIKIGAPEIADVNVSSYFTGKITVDNLKFVTGEAVGLLNPNYRPYPEGIYTYTSNAWRPRSDIDGIAGALVRYKYYSHGQTRVSIEYNPGTGWTTGAAQILGSGESAAISLSHIPSGAHLFRAQVSMQCTSGLPPMLDSIDLYTHHSKASLVLTPNWKWSHVQQGVRATIYPSTFKELDPFVDSYDEILVYSTGTEGLAGYNLSSFGTSGRAVHFSGWTGAFVSSTPRGMGFSNYALISGNQAPSLAGGTWEEDIYCESAPGDVSGHFLLPTGYYVRVQRTGVAMGVSLIPTIRPVEYANNEFLGLINRSGVYYTGYAIDIRTTGDSTGIGCGVEYSVTGSHLPDCSFYYVVDAPSGSAFKVWATGADVNFVHTVRASGYNYSKPLGFTVHSNSVIHIGIGGNIDGNSRIRVLDVGAYRMTGAYVESAHYSGASYPTGYGAGPWPIRDATVLDGVFNLYTYPTGTATLLKKGGAQITVNESGVLVGRLTGLRTYAFPTLYTLDDIWLTGRLPVYPQTTYYLGLVQQMSCFRDYDTYQPYSGTIEHLAKSNHLYLMMNNDVVAEAAIATGWRTYTGFTDSGPFTTTAFDEFNRFNAASGCPMTFDVLRHRRAPSVGLEETLIKHSRPCGPRLIPSGHYLPADFQSPGTLGTGAFVTPIVWGFSDQDGPVGFDRGFCGCHLQLIGTGEQKNDLGRNYTLISGSYFIGGLSPTLDRVYQPRTGVVSPS